jgi:hypothetical protein
VAELHDIYLDSIPIAEMDAGAEEYVPLDPKIVNRIKKDMEDENPQFPVIKVMEGTSRNKIRWDGDILVSIAEQINENQPVGYLGHIKPEDDRWVLPPPQTWWLKGVTKKEGDKTVLYVKGYNLPDEPIRRYVKAGVVNSVSWHGKAAVQHVKGGIQQVKEFALESIDWSRKGKAAMSARLVTVAAEMEGEEERVSDISKLTPAELKAENPNLYQLIVNETEAGQEEKIEELQEKAKDAETSGALFAKLREVLHIDDKADILEAVSKVVTAVEEIGRKNVTERLAAILTEKIKDDDARAAVMRLMPVAEMGDLDDDKLKEKVNETIDNDETIKAIVNRFSGSPAPLRGKGVSEMENSGSHRYDSGKSTGNVKVTRKKL